jgi:hypothetical protein
LYRRSLDGGATWSDTTVVNDDDPELLYGQFHPNLRVAPNGRLDLAWWDQRDAAGAFGTDVYYASSSDAGATWSANQRMTDRLIDRTIGVWTPGTGGDVRQPPGIASSDAVAYVVWDDTRNGNQVTQTQDLYAASAQYEPLAATGIPEAAGYALAVVIGVGVVGLILVIASKMMGLSRRPPGPPATPASADFLVCAARLPFACSALLTRTFAIWPSTTASPSTKRSSSSYERSVSAGSARPSRL